MKVRESGEEPKVSKFFLEKISTRQLLAWRDKCYAMGGQYSPDYHEVRNPIVYTLDEIKAELEAREHFRIKKRREKSGKRRRGRSNE